MSREGYGVPLICPKCPKDIAYRVLKTPRIKVPKCPQCGTFCVPVDPERRKTWESHRKRTDAHHG